MLKATITSKQLIGDTIRVAVHFSGDELETDKEYFLDDSNDLVYLEGLIAQQAHTNKAKKEKISTLFESIEEGKTIIIEEE